MPQPDGHGQGDRQDAVHEFLRGESDPAQARSLRATACGQRPGRRMNTERRPLTLALLLSLLSHALLLSLSFGGDGWLPGFGFPWQERRIEAPDLRVVLMPTRVAAAAPVGMMSIQQPRQPTSVERPAAGEAPLMPFASLAPTRGRTAEVIAPENETETDRSAQTEPTAEMKPAPSVTPEPQPDTTTEATPANAPLRTDGAGEAAPTPTPAPEVIAVERDEAAWVVPAAASAPTAVIAAAPSASGPQTVLPAAQDTGDTAREAEAQRQALQWESARIESARMEAERDEAVRQAAARRDVARQEAQRAENARLEAERQEATRQTTARQDAERAETARLEAERQETARQQAARREAQRAENVRLETERQEVARQAAARHEAAQQEAAGREAQRVASARLEAERQESARQAAARQETARVEAAQQDEARREASRRAMGRQLDEEAARREATALAANLPSRLPPSSSGARRGRLFGRTDANAELIRYAEAWARKIELNITFDMVRDVAKRPHTHPLVTVAIRSDGSVESVTFVLSSGVAEIDEAIRRIVQSQLPYQAFPPGLSREFDVIEIRRTWLFDTAVRLY